jgi:gamma-glutamylcyclotransferase
MKQLIYFAYGSNMSSKRLKQRVPSAQFVDLATLYGHDLRFHKKSHDGSAKCNALETGNADDYVIGTLFTMDAAHKKALDWAEGLGFGYEIKEVEVKLFSGQREIAFTYYATDIDETLMPYQWYHTHVLNGAIEHGLPKEYRAKIENVRTISDPDRVRHQNESDIHQ